MTMQGQALLTYSGADAADAGGNVFFFCYFERTELACVFHMRSSAKLAAHDSPTCFGTNGVHFYYCRIFMLEKRDRSELFRFFFRHFPHIDRKICSDLIVDQIFYLLPFLHGQFAIECKVESQALRVDVGTHLLDLVAEFMAQCPVKQVRCSMQTDSLFHFLFAPRL